MQLLRAFLYARDREGNWSVNPYRELEPLLDALSTRAQAGDFMALHIGFWRPDTACISAIAQKWSSALLLSESARAGMPLGTVTSKEPVERLDGITFFQVLSGLGYDCVEPAPTPSVGPPVAYEPATGASPVDAGNSSPADWIADLQLVEPALCEELLGHGIFNDSTYIARENNLRREARAKVGIARYQLRSGIALDPGTLLEHLAHCPPWLLALRLNALDLTVRLRNVFNAQGLSTVADVARFGYSRTLRLPNFGRGSAFAFGKIIWSSLLQGPHPLQGSDVNAVEVAISSLDRAENGKQIPLLEQGPSPSSFGEAIESSIRILTDIQREVLTARLGIRRDAETLQVIGERLGLTRERVRQIQHKALERLTRSPGLVDLKSRLEGLLKDRSTPLLVRGLSAVDSWFIGINDYISAFPDLCEHLSNDVFHAIQIGDLLIVTRLSRSRWEIAKKSARNALLSQADGTLNEIAARALIDSLLVGDGSELRDELWEVATEDALWHEDGARVRTFAGFQRSAEDLVLAILSSSESPLHFNEIARRASSLGHDYAPRRLHHAAAEVAYLLGRGIYGLKRHSPLSMDELASVRAEVESVILGGDPRRQWHSDELSEELEQRGFDFQGRLNKYILNLALEQSEILSYLGRMVWGLREAWVQEAASRLDTRQAVISVLEAAGTPLTAAEIKIRVQQGRGVDGHFQIFPYGPLVRLGPALWGLCPRDLDPMMCEPLLQTLTSELRRRDRGMHLTEVENLFGSNLHLTGADARAVIALGAARGLRIDRGLHVYLEEWGQSRRVSVSDAVKRALRDLNEGGAGIEEIHAAVNRIAERDVPRTIVSSVLQDCEAEWDVHSGRWKCAPSTAAG